MAIDYGEKERQFLDALKAETGRDLGAWMAAIDEAKLSHRNEVIDWLRQQGFMFSKASWLERIHTNAGKPIYAGRAARLPARARERQEPVRDVAPPPIDPPKVASSNEAAEPQPPPRAVVSSPPPPAAPPKSDPEAAQALLARGKAFRPLAQYLLAQIEKLGRGIVVEPMPGHFVLSHAGRAFGALIVSARDVRLALALDGQPAGAELQPARLPPSLPPGLTHMQVLTDARQVNEALLSCIKSAAGLT